ncbi:DEAD/DEAH box helicase family protein [Marinigracilibium pacificum]|uniref:DEAD/DEAH box helicase family protein n=1 Tax=Marinigracilibium pacificum TaxID=2729599 RepID=A0A848IW77_9BACT|nr:DEAD/DEAH box helicase family protein [Marinigracilibium pacificum]NMM47501.1 DEAD/DEAH box helicase family protein [Marinigracilibium pacificum]
MSNTNAQFGQELLSKFPDQIQFMYPWRTYQERVLKDLDEHINDDHLHIVAPPGSGKTVLGLEVMLRLNKPTLVLAPTIAIRNQWITRFCELFLQEVKQPDWITTDIRNPKLMTVVTYQGIHSVLSNSEEKKSIIEKLISAGVSTFVVDEAHHLKNEWWKSIMELKSALNPVIVGLTATPPYDVSYAEWQRYLELNGPVDAEIYVPELIKAGDLCPHQDYVYTTIPKAEERERIVGIREKIDEVFLQLKHDLTLISAIENSGFWLNPQEHYEWIYSNIEFYSASLIYLYGNHKEIPKSHFEVVGAKEYDIPVLDKEWVAIVIENYLFKNEKLFIEYKDHQSHIEKVLRRSGALEHSRVSFTENNEITKSLSSSISKLQGIKQITDHEHNNLKEDLRQVILCDYIRNEFLAEESVNEKPLNKIGVVPVFEILRREHDKSKKLGVLTGSLVIIPGSAVNKMQVLANQYSLGELQFKELPYDENYLSVNLTEVVKHRIVTIVTELFTRGEINILIGTKSLLGEGWDAPAINSLILASFVGSFVLSNQMRGRAIRIDKNNPDKSSNIWHLVCIDPTSKSGGSDVELMKRRFRSFVGVNIQEESSIENGFDRLGFPTQINNIRSIEQFNNQTLERASQRRNLLVKWKKGLENGTRMVEEIKKPFPDNRNYKKEKSLYFRNSMGNFTGVLGSSIFGYLHFSVNAFARTLSKFPNSQVMVWGFTAIISIGILFFGAKTVNSFVTYLRFKNIDKDLKKICVVLVRALSKKGIIKTDLDNIKIETSKDMFGGVHCRIEGGTTFECSTFINAVQEILSLVDNPRYLLVKKGTYKWLFDFVDYINVPEELGKKKEDALLFSELWDHFVGKTKLVFTRNPKGRKVLLKARVDSMSKRFVDSDIEHVNVWK